MPYIINMNNAKFKAGQSVNILPSAYGNDGWGGQYIVVEIEGTDYGLAKHFQDHAVVYVTEARLEAA